MTRHRQRPRSVPDRFQPALLDRLTDSAPAHRAEPNNGPDMSHAQLRAAVLRDLRWLLNTLNIESSHDLIGYDRVRTSTLNYGVGAMAGRRMSEVDWFDLELSITQAIRTFEPRILADTLKVRCQADVDELVQHNIVSLTIQGLLWCVPYPREFMFRSAIDLENGYVDLADVGAAS